MLLALLTAVSCSKQGGAADPAVVQAGGGESDWETLLDGGELIAAAVESPDTYYDEGGTAHGLQYALASDFAQRYGLRLRLVRADDEAEMLRLVRDGEADLLISPTAETTATRAGLRSAGAWLRPDSVKLAWAVSPKHPGLAKALTAWFVDGTIERVVLEQRMAGSQRGRSARVIAPPVLDAQRGMISSFDAFFREAAGRERLDWRLLAAVGYCESAFDPGARSHAGAQGVMQLMPATARYLGVADPLDAQSNIRGGARLLRELTDHFADIPSADERTRFALAAYNGGEGHIRDAQTLCRKYGGDATRWSDVREYVLRLSQMPYRTDPVVRHGAMNGGETVNYVSIVTSRYASYGGVLTAAASGAPARVAAPTPVKPQAPRLTPERTIAPAAPAGSSSNAPAPSASRSDNRFTRGNRVRPADDPAFHAVEHAEGIPAQK